MQSTGINRNSWHFKLALLWNKGLGYNHETNTCEYGRALLFGLIKAIFIIAVFSVFATLVVILPVVGLTGLGYCQTLSDAGLSQCFSSSIYSNDIAFIVKSGIVITFAALCASIFAFIIFFLPIYVVIAWEKLNKRFGGSSKAEESGIVKVLYRSWKDKVCSRISISD